MHIINRNCIRLPWKKYIKAISPDIILNVGRNCFFDWQKRSIKKGNKTLDVDVEVILLNIFNIIGPSMIGPSSSHTAGAVKLGRLARSILGEEPLQAKIIMYNSFAKTGHGHGTDKALIAGILGFLPDDERIRISFEEAKKRGLSYELVYGGDREDLHPNTAEFILKGEFNKTEVLGCSIGGGRVKVFAIDGFLVEFSGEYQTIITIHRDISGVIARVTSQLAEKRVNIAQMKVSRESRGEKALMIIETDEPIPKGIKGVLEGIDNIYRVLVIQPV
jgi:L-serine dehydratase